jgi:hypothetical protein
MRFRALSTHTLPPTPLTISHVGIAGVVRRNRTLLTGAEMLFWIAIALLVAWAAGAMLAVHELVHILLLIGMTLLLLAFARSHDAAGRG